MVGKCRASCHYGGFAHALEEEWGGQGTKTKHDASMMIPPCLPDCSPHSRAPRHTRTYVHRQTASRPGRGLVSGPGLERRGYCFANAAGQEASFFLVAADPPVKQRQQHQLAAAAAAVVVAAAAGAAAAAAAAAVAAGAGAGAEAVAVVVVVVVAAANA